MGLGDWSDWRKVDNDGTIPEELLPATQFQWLWKIHHEFDLEPYLGPGSGRIDMIWQTQIGDHEFRDRAPFSFMCIRDYIDPFITAQYSYWMQNGATERIAGTATQGGDNKGDLVFEASGVTWEFGVSTGFFTGDLIADQWVGDIYAGQKVKFGRYYPNSRIPKGKQLWMRTVGGSRLMQTLLDAVTHNKHEFWLSRTWLMTRQQRNADGSYDGVIAGGQVSWAAAGVIQIAPAIVRIKQNVYSYAGGQLAVTGNRALMLILMPGKVIGATAYQSGAIPYPNTVIARIEGSTINVDADNRGTMISSNCSDFSAWIEDDGALHIDTEKVSQRVRYVSRDRGASWGTR